MKRMSFALTTLQVRRRQKTVTRRTGWENLKPGEHVLAVEKCQGLKKGERQVVLEEIVIVAVLRERLDKLEQEGRTRDGRFVGCIAEGFPYLWATDFYRLYCKTNGGDPGQLCTRVEFRYAEPAERLWDGWCVCGAPVQHPNCSCRDQEEVEARL